MTAARPGTRYVRALIHTHWGTMHLVYSTTLYRFGHPTQSYFYSISCSIVGWRGVSDVCDRRQSNQVVRLVLVGGCATGKTCLLRRFLGGYFDEAGQQDYTRQASIVCM